MPTVQDLLKKKLQLQARIQMMQAKEETQKRKDDTRRKILVGAYIIDKHGRTDTIESLLEGLDMFLFRKGDRALFGLPAREEGDGDNTKPELS